MKQRAIAVVLIVAMFSACNATERRPAVAGQFYPADAGELSRVVEDCLSKVPPESVKGRIVALLAPHAGYEYSAQTAAYSFKLLSGMHFDNIIVIGNSHHFFFNKAAVFAKGSFITPLGNVPINESLCQAIINEAPDLIDANEAPHGPEHSIEVELPFLQKTLKTFRIAPILLSDFSPEQCEQIGNAIARAIKKLGMEKSVLIVESSDMSHYPSWANANMTDARSLKALQLFDAAALKKAIDSSMSGGVPNLECAFCGEKSLYATIAVAKALGATKVEILHYANSGDVTGDKSRVVGYGAAAFVAAGQNNNGETKMSDFSVSATNQKTLLSVARTSIEAYLKSGKVPTLKYSGAELSAPAAVFVTLTKHHNLRGCIGTTAPQYPLYEAVNRLAIAAAVEDTRFPTVTMDELKDLRIEISVLSPLTRIKNADSIIPKVHGVVARRGGRSGLFLPQVWEQLPDKVEFLSELCSQKAGLSPDAWKDPSTELYTFTVFAFEE